MLGPLSFGLVFGLGGESFPQAGAAVRLHTVCMTSATPHTQDLFTLHLRVGLPVERAGKTIFYKTVNLREITVADERWAVRQAERLVLWQGQPRLVVSDADHRLALTTRHIQSFVCDGQVIDGDLIDLPLIEKLRPVDVATIEERVFAIELAAKLRYGEITQDMFDMVMGGKQEPQQAPQPVGPAAGDGAHALADGSGPVMLADHSGVGAGVTPGGLGR